MTGTDGGRPRTRSEARAAHVRPLDAPPAFVPRTPRQTRRRARVWRRVTAVVAATALLVLGATVVTRLLATDGEPAAPSAGTDAYANGYLPEDVLVPIADGYRLVRPAAEAFERLAAAARQAGFELRVNSAYRTYDEQAAMVEQYGLLSEGGTAAEPGTSEHGWGTAVDLTLDAEQLAWFYDHAGEYGFAATIADEPWHWNYVGTG